VEECAVPDAVTCPSPQELSAFGLGKLPEAAAAAVAAHLEGCPPCREAVAGQPADSFLRKVRDARPSASTVPQEPAPPDEPAAPIGEAATSAAPVNVPPELADHPKFRVVRELGRGGMGVIYLAQHRVMDKPVALKVISPAVLDNPAALARFRGEARAAGKLDHQNIARAYDADQAGGLHFLVMEFVEAQSLAQLLEQGGPLPVANACHYACQAALGLQHAFEHGMVHRDVKPHNLMVTPRGLVKVLDFGVARLRSERTVGPRLTQLDSFMGTPEYVAPEQAADAREADIRADIYSLGCTLYALLTRRPPFVDDTAVKLVLAHREKQPQPLHEVRPDVPPELSTAVARMLAKDPARRYQRPVDVARALLPFVTPAGRPGVANGVSLPPLGVGDQIPLGLADAAPGAPRTGAGLKARTKAAPASRRAALIGGLAVVALVAVTLAGMTWLGSTKMSPGGPEPRTESPVPTGSPNGADRDKPTPNAAVRAIGSYIAPENSLSLLLQRRGQEDDPWTVLSPQARVTTAQALVSLPGYRSLLALDTGLELTLWGNLPDFSVMPPVLESVVVLHAPPDGTDLDFTLDRGRVVVANRKAPSGPARVRLRFLGEVWDVELPDPTSEVALELWGDFGSTGGPRPASPRTVFSLSTRGRTLVKVLRTQLQLEDRWGLSCSSDDLRTLKPQAPSRLPEWWAKVEPGSGAAQRALRSLRDWSDLLGGKKAPAGGAEPAVARIKTQVEEVSDGDTQGVGILFLGSLDGVEPLLGFLGDRHNQNVRSATALALQSWLSRGGQRARELADLLENRGYAKDTAQLIVHLLPLFPAEALGTPETYEALVCQLDDETLLVRDLSYRQLVQGGVKGYLPPEWKAIEYDPVWEHKDRWPAVEEWEALLADGKVPQRRAP
jgi:hypothetical protein